MTADTIMLEIDRARALAWEWAADPNRRQRSFWIGLSLAAAVHAVAIIGIGSAPPRTVGSPDGDKNAINVELVDEKSLRDSMSSVTPPPSPPPSRAEASPTAATPPPPPPPPPSPPEATPKPPAEPPPPAEKQATATPVEPLPAEEAAPPPPTKAKPEPPKPETAKPETPPTEAQKPNTAKPKPAQKNTQLSELTPPDQLDLSVPKSAGAGRSDASGSSSAVQRPPGITRSGENDEFARNVIRALQRSMPRQDGDHGRVTVRIVLSENGSRADVKLLNSGGNPDLDFNVMFAARQTAYPFPPKNSTVTDRTFMVTYIYR